MLPALSKVPARHAVALASATASTIASSELIPSINCTSRPIQTAANTLRLISTYIRSQATILPHCTPAAATPTHGSTSHSTTLHRASMDRSVLRWEGASSRRMFSSSFGNAAPMPSPGAIGATVRKAPTPRGPKRSALTLTPKAVSRLKELLSDPTAPKLLKIGTKKKGCSGQTYTLEYVEPGKHSKLDEIIEQDGVKVLIDSKALFSLIGSEMDFVEDVLSSQFIFNNPNIKEMCGCGQSFMV
ncbi:Iron-sulfur assembly protein 1 [Phlyctochytrium planicorne]|nr:Iron-sulfur assembly protein 1 [Phlyctochytrium planicorne]